MKKSIGILILAVMLLIASTGCSSTNSSNATPSTNASTASTASTASASTGTSTATDTVKDEKVEITLWNYFSQTNHDAFVAMINEYNALPDGKAIIKEQYMPRADLNNKYTLGAISGELPDIGAVDNSDSAPYSAMGVFVDLTDMFNAWDDNKYNEAPLNSGKYNGKQYTIPIRSNCLTLWINDDMFKQAGITEMPATWDDLKAVCDKLRTAFPNKYPLAFSALKGEEGTFQFVPFLYSAGATFETLDSPEGIKALSFTTELVKKKYASSEVVGWTQNDAEKQFVSGNAAMMINGCWQIPNIKKDAPDLKYTVVAIPKDKEYKTTLGGENFGITKSCKNVDAAWSFLTWLLGTDNSIKFNHAVGTLTPHSNVTADQQYPNDPVMKVFADSLQNAVQRGPYVKYSDISLAVQMAIQESLTNTKAPDAAAKDAAKKIADIVASEKASSAK